MKFSVSNSTWLFKTILLLILLLSVSCGNSINKTLLDSKDTNNEVSNFEETEIIDNDDAYYISLEAKLNDELDINRAPDKCAAQGLTKVVLSFTTDEIQTCATYDLSKVSVTAYFSDKTAEVITPIWSIYSGSGTLDGTIYTATNKPAIIVFKALYTENGISKLALFRLTVTGLSSISLNKTTDEIQLPAAYDLSTELLVTAKLSNGATKAVVKGDPNLLWTLASGAGTLADGVYTPSAKVETAVFNISYSENGVTKTTQFKLKVTGLSSLMLSRSTDEINSCESYDLASKIVVSNKLSNGTINDITANQNLTWTLSSGVGILEGKIYTAPAKAETAVFTASYTEAGITKTAQFRLKVTGLSSVVLDKTTDEIMLPATYDLASEINATAKFSDGDSKSVDLIWALSSGAGTLSGTLYTPAPKPETAVFIGSYAENGITKTAQFRLKVIGLSSLTLSKTTDEVVSCATYDLSQIIVSDKLSNGTINNISNSATWKLVSGFGTLSGKTYMAPARAETAAFTANYTEAGITKTVQFRLKVIALISISLSKTTDEAQILALYDLAVNISVTAKLSNSQTKPVAGNDSNLKWTLSYGSGILSGTVYTPPERIETAVLTATYKENGVAQSAQLRLKSTATLRKNIELVGLVLNKTTDSVAVGQVYDLSKLIAIAKFADKTTAEVTLSWVVTSGGGTIFGTTFTAPNNLAAVKLQGTYTALDGSSKSVYLTLAIYDDEIYGNRGIVTTERGARFHLYNGIVFEIPPHSIEITSEVTISFSNTYNTIQKLPGQTFFSCSTKSRLNSIKLYIPLSPGMTKSNVSMTCILPEFNDLEMPEPLINNNICVYALGSTFLSSSILRAPGDTPPTNTAKHYGNTVFILYQDDEIAQDGFFRGVSKTIDGIMWEGSINILCPYYQQYYDTCGSTTLLMLMKCFKYLRNSKELSAELDTIYKIHKICNLPLLNTPLGNARFTAEQQFLQNEGKLDIPGVVAYNNMSIKIYYCPNAAALVNLIVNNISLNKPVIVNGHKHSVLVTGYYYNGFLGNQDGGDWFFHNTPSTTINYKVSDPSGKLPFKTMELPAFYNLLIEGTNYTTNNDVFESLLARTTCYVLDTPLDNSKVTLQTIHLSDKDFANSTEGYDGGIELIGEDDKPITYTKWNLSCDGGIKWEKGDSTSSALKGIKFKNVPIYNTGGKVNMLVRASIYKASDINGENDPANLSLASKTIEESFNVDDVWKHHYMNLQNNNLITDFNTSLKTQKDSSDDYILRVKLLQRLAGPEEETGEPVANYLDKFDIKFKYTPPPTPDLAVSAEKKVVEPFQQTVIKAFLNDARVYLATQAWELYNAAGQLVSGILSFFGFSPKLNSPTSYAAGDPADCIFTAPEEPGIYVVKASYAGNEATCEITVLDLKMTNEVQTAMNPNDIIPFKVKITGVTQAKQIELESVNGEYTPVRQALDEIGHSMTFEYNLKLKDSVKATAKDITVDARIINFPVTRTTQSKINILRKELKIAPAYTELKMKQQLQFTALLNDATIETGILWSTESVGGTITSSGSYTAPVKPGTYLVTAKYEDVEATAEVRVIPSDFKIAPKQTTLIYGQQQQFAATVDNLSVDTNLAWSVEDPTCGSITSAGQYTAPNSVGTYIVKALYYGELEATAEVTVQAPVLQITPATKTLYTNETQNFALLVNNATQEAEIQWTSTGGSIGSNDGSYMAPDHAGTYIVTATFRTVEATAEVIVKEHEIKITPPSAEMNIGQQVQFTAFVDNATAETGVSWSTDVMGGTVTQTGLYTAPSLPGIHRVTAKYQGAETSAEVTVNSLFLTPLTYQLRTDQTVQFNLKYGVSEDTTNEVTTQALWKVVPEVGSVSSGLFDPAAVGNYKVTAEYAGMILTAEVTVTAADLKITPPSAVLNRSQQMTFKALVGDTTQETGISWSVVSPSGGTITPAGLYTAPAQWGKYVIKAVYQAIEATAEVKVNDERIVLQTYNTSMLEATSPPMKADGTSLYDSGARSFSIDIYGGIDVSTVELSLVEGNDKGRLVYSSKSGTTGSSLIRYFYYYYAPYSNKPYYDTNEIIHINARCPENSNSIAQRTVVMFRPLLSDTIEIDESANNRKWQFKSIGYRNQNGTWTNQSYKTGSYMLHGPHLGIWKSTNSVGYNQTFYCGENIGESRYYTYNSSATNEHFGRLSDRYTYTDFIKYKMERWQYTTEYRYNQYGTYIGTFNITNKLTEEYSRTSINYNYGMTSSQTVKYDGWVTP